MSIFHNDNTTAGFRLKYFQIFNWGTFDNEIWTIEPEMQNSLLTGANGSGKTTLIHGLLTLLVPRPSMFYNTTSDQTEKKERDEKSYFFGDYGRLKDDDKSASVVKQLRKNGKHYSVILARFTNQEVSVTLVQVRYLTNNQLKKELIISADELSINKHFKKLDPKGNWKKELKLKTNTEFFGDNFSKYSKRFSAIFGLKSEKALTLFAKTVGAKVLGNLNDFIRNNMLDETNAENDFADLLENYNTLLLTFRSIEKAEQQQKLLVPIIEHYDKYKEFKDERESIDEIKQIIPAYFATKKIKLTENEINTKIENLEQTERDLENINLPDLREELSELKIAKSNNKVTERLNSIEKDIKGKDKELKKQKTEAGKYDKIAKRNEFISSLSENDSQIFYQSLKDAQSQIVENNEKQKKNDEKWSDVRNEKIEAEKIYEEKYKEVEYLRKSGKKITGRTAQIRDEIALHLNIKPSELPFVGELLQVKKSQKDWESAIERLLHTFALKILVKDEYYQQVNEYVNKEKLNGKITYVKLEQKLVMNSEPNKNSLYNKLEIKPDADNIYTEYIDSQLRAVYDYYCTQNKTDFRRSSKALMLSGLFKNKNYHERDDRRRVVNSQYYILGWDNKDKIKAIEKELKNLDSQISDYEKEIKRVEKDKEKLKKKNDDLIKFTAFDDFEAINWKKTQIEVQDLIEQKNKLTESSDQLKEIENKIKVISDEIKEKEKTEKNLNQEIGKIKTEIDNLNSKLQRNTDLLADYNHIEVKKYYSSLEKYITNFDFSLNNIEKIENTARKSVNDKLSKIKEGETDSKTSVERAMRNFTNPDETIKEKFPTWSSETINLQDDISYFQEFNNLLTNIKEDDLPSLKIRFKTKLQKDIIDRITIFKAELEREEKKIKDKIDDLNNHSLKQINYSSNPETFITIQYDNKNIDKSIRNFKDDLKGIMEIYGAEYRSKEQTFKNTFERIKKLIDELTENDRQRKKIIDVRNWLTFSAVEKYRADNIQKRYYEDSKGLSDGEKTKLAYTILASALAFQFNIKLSETRQKSFRFVVIDEAFGKIDPTNADYAMKLFEQLKLQVMIVTPLDKINIVENYVNHYAYVEKKENNKSRVFNIDKQAYIDLKEKYKANEISQ